jgi:hypothetical protein
MLPLQKRPDTLIDQAHQQPIAAHASAPGADVPIETPLRRRIPRIVPQDDPTPIAAGDAH